MPGTRHNWFFSQLEAALVVSVVVVVVVLQVVVVVHLLGMCCSSTYSGKTVFDLWALSCVNLL